MTTQQTSRAGRGGAVSIGSGLEEDQDPLPDGEELPEEGDVAEETRDPDPTPDEKATESRA